VIACDSLTLYESPQLLLKADGMTLFIQKPASYTNKQQCPIFSKPSETKSSVFSPHKPTRPRSEHRYHSQTSSAPVGIMENGTSCSMTESGFAVRIALGKSTSGSRANHAESGSVICARRLLWKA
jgi:hypothetical protein